MTVYDTIKSICKEKGISIMELEQQANVGNGTIGSWRKNSMRLTTLEKVASALNVPVTTLIDTIVKNREESCHG